MANINRVVLTGNLTADPELRSLPSGATLCRLRIACNTRRRNAQTGEWEDKPNYFNVTVWGGQAESAARYLAKGRPVAIDGRLEWREWQAEDGSKRQTIDIIAEHVQFLGSPREAGGPPPVEAQPEAIDSQDFQDPVPIASGSPLEGDEEVPF